MSSLNVRNTIRTAVQDWITNNSPTTGFYDTINIATDDPTETYWVTVQFSSYYSERTAIGCDEKAEYGSADIFVFGRAGLGDTQVVTIADSLSDALDSFSQNGVTVENIDPPTEAFNGDAQHWYGVYVTLEYVSYS